MTTRAKTILVAAALAAAASSLSALAADQGVTLPVAVYSQSTSEDQAITNEVVDKIASDPTLSGKIGVETLRGKVTLTGRVTTPGEELRAERDARSVESVRDVESLVHTRVGED